jgi:fructokinase
MAPLGDGGAVAAAASNNLVVSFGEMLIDFVPDVAGLSLAESGGFVKAPGGAPANVACAIAKLGGSSAFVGKVRPVSISVSVSVSVS